MSTDTVGGVWTYSLTLARALRAHGVEVVLATMGAPLSSVQRREAGEAGLAELHESNFALEWMDEPWRDVEAAGEWLLELACEKRPDVAHLCSFAHAPLAWPAATVLVAHSCVVSWWHAVHGTEPPRSWDRYRAAVRAGLHGAGAVVAPTSWMLGELRRHHGLRSGATISNASEASEAGDAPKEPLVLAAGRLWDPAKNLAALDRAADGLTWPVLAAGQGGDGRHVRAMGALGRDELADLRAAASIFVAPARYEPFGLAALEAARAGCSLVLGDIPSLREVWGNAALFVDPGDHHALRDALERLISDGGLRADMARRACLRAARYRSDRMAAAYVRLYRRVRATAADGATA